MMCFHKFCKWSNIVGTDGATQIQFKKCKKCGIVKVRTVSCLIGISFVIENINKQLNDNITN